MDYTIEVTHTDGDVMVETDHCADGTTGEEIAFEILDCVMLDGAPITEVRVWLVGEADTRTRPDYATYITTAGAAVIPVRRAGIR
jgi:hypothetical protein